MSRRTKSSSVCFVVGAGAKKSEGTRNDVPYVISAGLRLLSSRSAVRNPRSTVGSSSLQLVVAPLAIKAAFSVRCQRSICPFDCGWYAVVRILLMPSFFVSASNNDDSNCLP